MTCEKQLNDMHGVLIYINQKALLVDASMKQDVRFKPIPALLPTLNFIFLIWLPATFPNLFWSTIYITE